jgi:hypothetical protein
MQTVIVSKVQSRRLSEDPLYLLLFLKKTRISKKAEAQQLAQTPPGPECTFAD